MDADMRQAVGSDLPAIHALIADAYSMYLSRMDQPPAPMLRDYTAAIQSGTTRVAGDPVIGVISLLPRGDSLLIENVAMHPSAQGRGLGRRLMTFAESQARRQGHSRLFLYTSEAMTENLAIYARLGYTEFQRRTEDGYHRVYMEKRLPDGR
jgi:N-acetylglutamate synthase-like GNAT family acetyltransferase